MSVNPTAVGTYTYQLTVTDNNLLTHSDTMIIIITDTVAVVNCCDEFNDYFDTISDGEIFLNGTDMETT